MQCKQSNYSVLGFFLVHYKNEATFGDGIGKHMMIQSLPARTILKKERMVYGSFGRLSEQRLQLFYILLHFLF